ncbi:hypothetical protein [Alicyclobacillus contaminans]|uniref:hypothetical protein n=1 Tax=Alicyclobacillus contaminans TaxID=392016 RepID=UPI000417E4A7|nr:hypothetical protein [Alicyclobacillus contaminans]
MSRIVQRPIRIHRWRNGKPLCFSDGPVVHRVREVIDSWSEMGNWWDGEGGRTMLRVWTDAEAAFDLECVEERWFIYRIWD